MVDRATDQFAALKAALFDAFADPLVGVDAEGCIISWNAAAERTFGYTSLQAVGLPMVELIVPVRLRERHLRGFSGAYRPDREQLSSQPIETCALRSDGS